MEQIESDYNKYKNTSQAGEAAEERGASAEPQGQARPAGCKGPESAGGEAAQPQGGEGRVMQIEDLSADTAALKVASALEGSEKRGEFASTGKPVQYKEEDMSKLRLMLGSEQLVREQQSLSNSQKFNDGGAQSLSNSNQWGLSSGNLRQLQQQLQQLSVKQAPLQSETEPVAEF